MGRYNCKQNLNLFSFMCANVSSEKNPKVCQYGSKKKILYTPMYEEIMPKRRIEVITIFLQFTNNEEQSKEDRIFKRRSIVT